MELHTRTHTQNTCTDTTHTHTWHSHTDAKNTDADFTKTQCTPDTHTHNHTHTHLHLFLTFPAWTSPFFFFGRSSHVGSCVFNFICCFVQGLMSRICQNVHVGQECAGSNIVWISAYVFFLFFKLRIFLKICQFKIYWFQWYIKAGIHFLQKFLNIWKFAVTQSRHAIPPPFGSQIVVGRLRKFYFAFCCVLAWFLLIIAYWSFAKN